ncbi:MAG: hypothetical protein KDA44_15485 [Planctomycetales bacterium]|nr:hypothetical protein [Planctomycetales bacterium]
MDYLFFYCRATQSDRALTYDDRDRYGALMKFAYQLVAVITLATLCNVVRGALVAGDIAIIGVNTDDSDSFAWFPLVDLDAGEAISFTDSGWLSSDSFRGNEGGVSYTVPSGGISAGTILTFVSPPAGDYATANDANVGTNSFNLSSSGDQVFAFSGASASPVFLFGVQTNSTVFQSTASSSNDSALPTGLTLGQTALAVGTGSGSGDEYDNSYYVGSLVSGTREQLLAAIADPANWSGTNSRISDLTNGVSSFVVVSIPEASSFLLGGMIAAVGGLSHLRRWRRRRRSDLPRPA